jgi:hypothetical protein|tara:strand:- start:399 stop:557 length:159 start_codon:yes stop_codon:yes gene_type:complete
MLDLKKLKENLTSDILLYLDSYPELPSNDLFALRLDLAQIIADRIDEVLLDE